MSRLTPGGLSPARLRWILGGFFLALALPTTVLVVHAYDQLKWEAFHQAGELAQAIARRVDERLQRLVAREDARDFAQYQFLVVRGSGASNFVQPSQLSEFPPTSEIPGLVGYFQVDAEGRFTTPLLPAEVALAGHYGLSEAERQRRLAREDAILTILSRNALADSRASSRQAAATPAVRLDAVLDAMQAQSAESDLMQRIERSGSSGDEERAAKRSGEARSNAPALHKDRSTIAATGPGAPREAKSREDGLRLESPYPAAAQRAAAREQIQADGKQSSPRRSRRKLEQSLDIPLRELRLGDAAKRTRPERRITTFESELDPLELSRLDSGHLILHRTAWRDGQRYTQGALIEHAPFMDRIAGESFRASRLAHLGELTVAWDGAVSAVFPTAPDDGGVYPIRAVASPGQGTLLYRTRLSAPASRMELLFGVTRVSPGPGARVLVWATAVIALVLAGGLALMYRLGLREIDLARQQQDFVAAVSHELRTPLTSIRMYGELLREGWASEEKKRGYYDFICHESERLSRLISNVLQLARMTRDDDGLELTSITVGELMSGVHSKASAQAESSGFELDLTLPEALARCRLEVNADAFTQIMINLVDNAIKFSARSATRCVEIAVKPDDDGKRVLFSVRDHGPGVERDQMRKIFRLFYRSENELTRETVGTGIGLALVNRLARAMNADVTIAGADPGAVFTLRVPRPRRGH